MKPNLKDFPKHKNPHEMSREAIIHSYTEWKERFKAGLREKTWKDDYPEYSSEQWQVLHSFIMEILGE